MQSLFTYLCLDIDLSAVESASKSDEMSYISDEMIKLDDDPIPESEEIFTEIPKVKPRREPTTLCNDAF